MAEPIIQELIELGANPGTAESGVAIAAETEASANAIARSAELPLFAEGFGADATALSPTFIESETGIVGSLDASGNKQLINATEAKVDDALAAGGDTDTTSADIGGIVDSPVPTTPNNITITLNTAAELGPTATAAEITETSKSSRIIDALNSKFAKYVLVSATVLSVWTLGGKNSLDSFLLSLTNSLTETAKNLIGAMTSIAKSLTDPLGAGLGSAVKTILIIIGAVAGVALLGFAGYKIYQKVQADKAKKNK